MFSRTRPVALLAVVVLAGASGCIVNEYDQRVLIADAEGTRVERADGRKVEVSRPEKASGADQAAASDPEYPFDDFYEGKEQDATPKKAPARSSSSKSARSDPWDYPWGDPEYDRQERVHTSKRRLSHDPIFSAHLTLGGGRLDHETRRSPFDDDEEAAFFRLRVEGLSHRELGFGVSHEYTVSSDELLAPAGADLGYRLQQHDTYLYLYAMERFPDDFRFPIRFGPYFNYLSLADENSSDELEWFSIGARLSVEPELILTRDDQFELSLYGDASIGVHGTIIDSDTSTVRDEFETSGATLGIEAGLRYRFGTFSMALAYLQRSIYFDESDPERGVFVRESDDLFRGVVLSMGVRF